MEDLSVIKTMMSAAFIFYAAAMVVGKNQVRWKLPKKAHVTLGTLGFILDMWATWKMEILRVEGWSGSGDFQGLVVSHTIVSTLAIILFITMVVLGARGNIETHRKVAWRLFLPSWVLAYVSGILLVI